MGGDGGSIPRREELVRNRRRPERVTTSEANAARWKHCALSQDSLREPVVTCKLGRLYNKESVIEKILKRKTFPPNVADHIKKSRDFRQLKFTKATFHRQTSSAVDPEQIEAFACPIMNFELDGQHPAVAIWKCGCVFSKRALDSVQSKNCLVCGGEFLPEDVILLNPTEQEDIEAAKLRLVSSQTTVKSKKRPVVDTTTVSDKPSTSSGPLVNEPLSSSDPDVDATMPGSVEHHKVDRKKSKRTEESKTHITHSASGKQESLADTGGSNMLESNSVTTAIVGSFTSSDSVISTIATTSSAISSTSSYSAPTIQLDPNSSKVYKSLFTTSEQAKNQPKAHWVTYSPLYF